MPAAFVTAPPRAMDTNQMRKQQRRQQVADATAHQLVKSSLCRFYASNQCRKGTSCPYAHGESELKARPNLTKTTICRNWISGCCAKKSAECNFAHGEWDLRSCRSNSNEVANFEKAKSAASCVDATFSRQISRLSECSTTVPDDDAADSVLRSCLRKNWRESSGEKEVRFSRTIEVCYIPGRRMPVG